MDDYDLGTQYTCPNCGETEFDAELEAQVRISESMVTELQGVDIGGFDQLTCTSCDWRGPAVICRLNIEKGLCREKALDVIGKLLLKAGYKELSAVLSVLSNVKFEYVDVDGTSLFVRAKEKEKEKKK